MSSAEEGATVAAYETLMTCIQMLLALNISDSSEISVSSIPLLIPKNIIFSSKHSHIFSLI